jgi:triosephosphate isomerase (TIM)
MKRYLIAGNWKMNCDIDEAKKLARDIVSVIDRTNEFVDLLISPPFINLTETKKILSGSIVKLGAQNCHWKDSGAYTGEISCRMIKSIGCDYVIIGHSERRQYFGETDQTVNLKINAAKESSLIPIVCIGETLEERNKGITFEVLSRQLNQGFDGLNSSAVDSIVVAYEPVWAIGTGVAATVKQVDEAHNRLRDMLTAKYDSHGTEILLLYGGSVNEKNAKEILSLENVNGALIGGASLKSDSFIAIYNDALSLA